MRNGSSKRRTPWTAEHLPLLAGVQRDVVAATLTGATNHGIAKALGVNITTVREALTAAKIRVGFELEDRAGAVAMSRRERELREAARCPVCCLLEPHECIDMPAIRERRL